MDRAKVREVMDLTLCTEARARAALATCHGVTRRAVNEVLSPAADRRRADPPAQGGLHERTLRQTLARRGQTADEAFAARELAEAMARSMGSSLTPAEELEMVERLRHHTDSSRAEARAALVMCAWHEGRAAEQLLPAKLYLSPQQERAKKIQQVRDVARVDARWAELALDSCDGDADAAVAFVCGGMSPPSRRVAAALEASSSALDAARRARAAPLDVSSPTRRDDRPAPLETPPPRRDGDSPLTTRQQLVSPKALNAIPDSDIVAQAAADLERALCEAENRKKRATRKKRSLPSPSTPLSPERRAASLAAAEGALAASARKIRDRDAASARKMRDRDAAAARQAASDALQAERDRARQAALAAAEQRAREAAAARAAAMGTAAMHLQAAHRGRGGRLAVRARREAAAALGACARRRQDRLAARAEAAARRDAAATLGAAARQRQARLAAQSEAAARRDAAILLGGGMRQRQARRAAQAEAAIRRTSAATLGGGVKCALARRRVAAVVERARAEQERLRRDAAAAADRPRKDNAARAKKAAAAVVLETPTVTTVVLEFPAGTSPVERPHEAPAVEMAAPAPAPVVETPAELIVVEAPVVETAAPAVKDTLAADVPVAPPAPVVEAPVVEAPVAVADAKPRPAKALVERVLMQLAKPPAVVPPVEAAVAAFLPRHIQKGPQTHGRNIEARTTERELSPLSKLRRAARGAAAANEKRPAAGSALVAIRMSSSAGGPFTGDFGGSVPMRKM